jgi:RNA polymerase sigma factor (sigma-70 family)
MDDTEREQEVQLDAPATLDLIRGAQTGDRKQAAALYEQVAPAVFAWSHLRMSPALRRRIDPNDVVQEVWLRALTKLDDFDPHTTPFRPWILGVARYVLIELSRKQMKGQADKESGGQPWDSYLDKQADGGPGVSTFVGRVDFLRYFLEKVERIGEQEKELLILRGLEERPLAEIAEKLGMSTEALGKRWQRLRSRLLKDGPPPELF